MPASAATARLWRPRSVVQLIFGRYLDLGSVNLLWRELNAQGVVSKMWITAKGRRLGGLPFSRGALFHLLKNPIFAGDIVHRDKVHPGLHPAILDRELFTRLPYPPVSLTTPSEPPCWRGAPPARAKCANNGH